MSSVGYSKCQQNPRTTRDRVCILGTGVGSGVGIAGRLQLVSHQSKARMPRQGTKNHSGGHMAQKSTVQKSTVPPSLSPGEAMHGKESKNEVKGHPTPHVATASLRGPARGTQATGPVPAANNGETGVLGQLCPQEPQSLYPPHSGCIIIRNCICPAPVGLARWHVRGLEALFDALASL